LVDGENGRGYPTDHDSYENKAGLLEVEVVTSPEDKGNSTELEV